MGGNGSHVRDGVARSLRVPEVEWRAFKARAAVEGVSLSVWVRRACRDALELARAEEFLERRL